MCPYIFGTEEVIWYASKIFGTEEVTNHDAITKKEGKFKLLGSQRVAMDLLGLAPAPVDFWAEVRPSGHHQEAKTKP